MKLSIPIFALIITLGLNSCEQDTTNQDAYLQTENSIQKRVSSILAQMTIDEKVAQTTSFKYETNCGTRRI